MGRNWQRFLRGNPPVLSELDEDFSEVEYSILSVLSSRSIVEFEFDLELCSYMNNLVLGYLIEDEYRFGDILKPQITSRGEHFVQSYVPEEQDIHELVEEKLIDEVEED